MKNVLLLFLFVLLASCSSENSNVTASKKLEGKWNWIQSTGGIAGTTNTPQSSNQVIYIEFSGNSFKKYINGKLSADHTFIIKTDKSIFGGERQMIVNDNPITYFPPMSYEIDGNKLSLSEECYDCFGSQYERIK